MQPEHNTYPISVYIYIYIYIFKNIKKIKEKMKFDQELDIYNRYSKIKNDLKVKKRRHTHPQTHI